MRAPNDLTTLTADQTSGFFTASAGFNFAAGTAASTSYSRLGTATTTHNSHLSTSQDLLISGDVEIDGSFFADAGLFGINGEFQGTASGSYGLFGGLQVAGFSSASYSRFGTATTGHSLSAAQDLLISGLLEVDGNAFLDGKASVSGNFQTSGRFIADTAASHSFTGDLTISKEFVSSGTASNSFAGSLLISKGLDANSYQGGGLTACATDGKVLRFNSGQFSCGTLADNDIPDAITASNYLLLSGGTLTGNLFGINAEFQGTASASYGLFGALQVGAFSSVSYSRFGSSTTGHSNYMASANDLLVSGDFETIGSVSLGNNSVTVTAGGNVGIGTTSPGAKLQVSGPGVVNFESSSPQLKVVNADSSQNLAIQLDNSSVSGGRKYSLISSDGGQFRIRDNTAVEDRIAIGSDGAATFTSSKGYASNGAATWTFNSTNTTDRGIEIQESGTAHAKLRVDSSDNFSIEALTGSLALTGAGSGIVSVTITNTTTATAANMVIESNILKRSTSSARYKTNIEPMTDWRWLLDVQPVTFNPKTDPDGRKYGGLIAEEIAEEGPTNDAGYPLFAGLDELGRPDDVAYPHLVAPIIVGLQEHEARIASLSFRIDQLEQANVTVSSTGFPGLGSILDSVRAMLSDGSLALVKAVEGVFAKLTTDELEVKTAATFHQAVTVQQGITIIDQGDGQPYCFTMLYGSPTTIPGACSTPTATPPPTLEPEPTPSDTPTPEPDPEPTPEPTATPEPTPSE